ncbi:PREDICTED: cysteine proteinase 3-like [Rhagoletis zephyria]|uniref:cysteine proteinase 3-like n=1 Tax=Rhagoletis zephyria TaxID=28612 RepID=UPI000811238E|nr:PREDICTED: cysteine proteinase 3-like [Rhagoletis zephyria]
MLVRRRTLRSNATLSLSEQQLLNCAVEDACRQGGDAGTALSYVKNYGLSEEKAVPYVGGNGPCPYAAIDYFYPIDEYCVRSRFRYSYQSLTEQVDDAEMQRILVQMGPLYVVVDGRPELFRNYRSGVVDESEGCSNGGQVNHAVLLVGYTEDAWLLRDSYGRRWGEEGYFRLARGRNVCGVNSEIAWPLI